MASERNAPGVAARWDGPDDRRTDVHSREADVTPKTESGRLDAAWKELEADALASDGPIRDSDVKDAIRRQRPRIEQEAASKAVAEVFGNYFEHHPNADDDEDNEWCMKHIPRIADVRALIDSERKP